MSSWRRDGGAALASLTADTEGLAGGRVAKATGSAVQHRPGRLVRGRVRLLMISDLVAIQIAYLGMYLLAEQIGPPAFIAPDWLLAALWAASSVGWVFLFAAYRLYEGESRAIAPNSFDEVGKVFHALLAGRAQVRSAPRNVGISVSAIPSTISASSGV